ncbi:MAG: SIMPL domain-containing protein [Pseudomonadota bacterium]
MTAHFFSAPARLAGLAGALALFIAQAACAQVSEAGGGVSLAHPNSIQPETTLSLQATGEVLVEPDMAIVSTGVRNEAETAGEAMAQNRAAMNGVFNALEAAGITGRDVQTSNFFMSPVYDFIDRRDGGSEQVLRGFQVSNQVTARVRDLDALGGVLDAVAEAGGNTFNGIVFAVDDDAGLLDQARKNAMETLLARAELYAEAAGYRVTRLVSVSEFGGRSGPQPMMEMARSMPVGAVAPTPIAGGEVGYTVELNALFELAQ